MRGESEKIWEFVAFSSQSDKKMIELQRVHFLQIKS